MDTQVLASQRGAHMDGEGTSQWQTHEGHSHVLASATCGRQDVRDAWEI